MELVNSFKKLSMLIKMHFWKMFKRKPKQDPLNDEEVVWFDTPDEDPDWPSDDGLKNLINHFHNYRKH